MPFVYVTSDLLSKHLSNDQYTRHTSVCLTCHSPDSCAADGFSDTATCCNHWRNENTNFFYMKMRKIYSVNDEMPFHSYFDAILKERCFSWPVLLGRKLSYQTSVFDVRFWLPPFQVDPLHPLWWGSQTQMNNGGSQVCQCNMSSSSACLVSEQKGSKISLAWL